MRLDRLASVFLFSSVLLTHDVARSSAAGACAPTHQWTIGSFGTGQGQFDLPMSVCVLPSGSVAVVDFYNSRIQVFLSDGSFVTEWSVPNLPVAIDSDHLGRLFVVTWYGPVYVFSEFGLLQNSWLPPQKDGYYLGRDLDVHGNEVYIATNAQTITRFTLDGVYLGDIPTKVGLRGIAVGANGDVYVANDEDHDVCRYSSAGSLLGCWGSLGAGAQQFDHPRGLTTIPGGDLVIADDYNHRISVWTGAGQFLCTWGTAGSGPGQFQFTGDVAIGPDGSYYVCDMVNRRVHRFGDIATSAARRSWGQVKSLYR